MVRIKSDKDAKAFFADGDHSNKAEAIDLSVIPMPCQRFGEPAGNRVKVFSWKFHKLKSGGYIEVPRIGHRPHFEQAAPE